MLTYTLNRVTRWPIRFSRRVHFLYVCRYIYTRRPKKLNERASVVLSAEVVVKVNNKIINVLRDMEKNNKRKAIVTRTHYCVMDANTIATGRGVIYVRVR